MTNLSKGLLAAITSNALFAMLFLYGIWMQPMSGTEIFAWRMVAMLSALCVLMTMANGWQAAARFANNIGRDWKRWLLIVLPTPIFASQLWLFVWGPVNGEGVNVAMGYFLFPLSMMLGGRIWFKERLNRLQTVAVALACTGVACELVRSGAFSWTTVWVFGTYPFYYLLRRKLGVPSLIGLTFDLMMITPFALAYILLATEGDFGLLSDGLVSASSTDGQALTFSGVGVYHPALFKDTPAHQAAKLAPLLRQAMSQSQISGEHHNGLWLDVGTVERLQEADRIAQSW